MAKKFCSKKESCINGNILQDYSNFSKKETAKDGHESECKDCITVHRRRNNARLKEARNDFKNFFI